MTNTTGAPAPAFTDADLLKALRYVTDLFEAEEMPSNARKCRAAADRLEALTAQNAALKEALTDIGIYGCGMLNQPAAMNGPNEAWLERRIAEYERRARTALKEAGSDE